MFRFFLFVVGMMAAGAGMAGDASPCPGDTLPVRILTPDRSSFEPRPFDVAEIKIHSPSGFSGFVIVVTERITAQLAKEKLCITGAENTENMDIAERNHRSLLLFVDWPLSIHGDYIVPVMPFAGGTSGCKISSPWIDFTFVRTPVPSIHGVIRWSERQMLADQAVLTGVRHVPTGVAMPLKMYELGQFVFEYGNTDLSDPRAVRSIEDLVPPDILWLLRRSPHTATNHMTYYAKMNDVSKKGAEGYTKLVLALLDRCFASNEEILRFHNILDVDDPVLFEQYKIDMPLRY
jgi:hypothetical protein